MYEIGVVGMLLPGKEHGKKAPNPDAFEQNRHCIAIETLRNPVFLQSYSPSNYRKLKTGDRHQKSMLVSDVVYNGGRTIGRAMLQANHRDDDSYPTLLTVKSPVSERQKRSNGAPWTFSHSDKLMP